MDGVPAARARLHNLGLELELTEEVKKFISDKGYDSQFGARPLHRAIQKYLEDPLAEEILNMNVKTETVSKGAAFFIFQKSRQVYLSMAEGKKDPSFFDMLS